MGLDDQPDTLSGLGIRLGRPCLNTLSCEGKRLQNKYGSSKRLSMDLVEGIYRASWVMMGIWTSMSRSFSIHAFAPLHTLVSAWLTFI